MNPLLSVWWVEMSKKIAILLLVFAPVILFSNLVFGGKALFWGLPELQFYPWRMLAYEQILNGYMPLWNPYNGLGSPLMANYQSALIYPATGLLFVFYWLGNLEGMVWGHMLVNVGHIILSGIGMYKVCQFKNSSSAGSVLAGITFSLGGYLVARFGFFSMVWTMAWFPWVFVYTMQSFEKSESGTNYFKLILSITFMLLAGHAQLSWYTLLFCGLWLLSRFSLPVIAWGKKLLYFLAACTYASALGAIQLLPTAEYLLQSQRSTNVDIATALTYSFWPWHLLNFINPSLFGNPAFGNYWGYGAFWEDSIYLGLLPFLLLLGSFLLLFNSRTTIKLVRKEICFFWFMILIGILLSLGKNLIIFPWIYQNIPTFNMFNAPSRYMIWVVFSASILIAATFDQWKQPLGKVLYWVRLGTAGGFGVGLGAMWMMISHPEIEPTFITATFQISVLTFLSGIFYLTNPNKGPSNKNVRRYIIWQVGVILFVFLDLFFLSYGTIPVEDLSRVQDFKQSNSMNLQRIYWDEGDEYNFRYGTVLDFNNYEHTLSASELGESQLSNINIFNHGISLNNFEPMRLNNYDQFVKALESLSSEAQLEVLAKLGIDTIFSINPENRNTILRTEIVPEDAIQFSTGIIYGTTMEPFINNFGDNECITIMQEGNEAVSSTCEKKSLQIKALIWEGNTISFETEIPQDGWLLIVDAYAPGWKATVDGQSVPISPANGFLKAIPITAGFHAIRFRYLPISFVVGALLSLVSLVSLGILYIKNNRKNGVNHDS